MFLKVNDAMSCPVPTEILWEEEMIIGGGTSEGSTSEEVGGGQ